MQTLKLLILRILTIILVLFGIGAAQDSSAGAACFFVGAVLLWPSVGAAVGRATSKRWLAPVAGLLVAFIVAPIVFVNTQPTSDEIKAREEKRMIAEAERKEQKRVSAEEEAAAKAKEKRDRNCSDNTMAYIMSRHFVERGLKSPSTAKFPSYHTQGVYSEQDGECKFKVQGFVDAQNSFGAIIRSIYIIDMRYNPDSNTWSGTKLKMQN